MIGIPIEMYPEFPNDANTVLLTEDAKYDPQIVSKIKAHLEKGGTVIITTGLLKALQGNGPNQIGQIAEISTTGNVLNADQYQGSLLWAAKLCRTTSLMPRGLVHDQRRMA